VNRETPMLSRAEQETILRWDDETATLDIYTASPRVALRLQRRGYALAPIGTPARGWRLQGVPLSALTFRRIGADCAGRPKRAVSDGLRRARAVRETTQRTMKVGPDDPLAGSGASSLS